MHPKINLHPGMGPLVIAHLNRLAPLPATGIVAGQSVASAVFDLFGRGGGVYNDIDIFSPAPSRQIMVPAWRKVSTVTYTAAGVDCDYAGLTFLRPYETYRVVRAWREGLINHVHVDAPLVTPALILSGFDLNCTRVAVDLETRQLHWLPEFAYFLDTAQLELTTLHTPWHSALRFVKKLADLPWAYGDLAANLEVACLPHALHQEWFSGPVSKGRLCQVSMLAPRFGQKYADLYAAHRSTLAPYFDLRSANGIYWLDPRGTPDSGLLDATRHLGGTLLQLGPKVAFATQRRQGAATLAKVGRVRDAAFGLPAFLAGALGSLYVAGQITDRHLSTVDRLLQQHPRLSSAFVGLTLDEQLQAQKRLARAAKVHGYWVYGTVENFGTAGDLRHDHDLAALLAQHEKQRTLPLVDAPLVPARRIGPLKVEEIVTQERLEAEGGQMRHCVAGYATAIRCGRCRIVSLRVAGDKARWSTAELAHRERGWGIVQHCGRRNERPHWHNRLALYWTVAGLSPWWSRPHVLAGLLLEYEARGTLFRRHLWRLKSRMRSRIRDRRLALADQCLRRLKVTPEELLGRHSRAGTARSAVPAPPRVELALEIEEDIPF